MMKTEADVVLRCEATLGEGALWDDRRERLLWVDILSKQVGVFDPGTGKNESFAVDSPVGTVVPSNQGDLMVALQAGFARLDITTGVRSHCIVPPGHDATRLRFNDGKCDPSGRFWAGTMALDGRGNEGALYSLDADGQMRKRFSPVGISNGIAWSKDGTKMYYIDTPTRSVAEFQYDPGTGDLTDRKVAIEFPPSLGWPDGMTIDAEGMLWIAFWDGSAVSRWDPNTGKKLSQYSFPATRVTACALGGSDLDTLYVTSARIGLTDAQLEAQPLAGSIFAVRTNTTGISAFRYAG